MLKSNIMLPDENPLEPTPVNKSGKRPFSCKVILAMVMTYFVILSLIFIAGLIFSGEIRRILENYVDPTLFKPHSIVWFFTMGSLLFSLSSLGLILQSFRRRGGFYLFFLAALTILTLDLSILPFDWFRYLVHSGLIFLAGMVHFSKRCYTGKQAKAQRGER